jgi:hypothetical protein
MAFAVDYTTVSTADAINRFISLTGTPISATNVAMDMIGGTAQALTGDFGVDGTRIKWDSPSYGLYNQVASGDNIRVIYDRS